MDDALRDQILDAFPLSKCIGVRKTYRTGLSNTMVLAVEFASRESSNSGMNGAFVVKIGPQMWADHEEQLFGELKRQGHVLSSLIAVAQEGSMAIAGYRALAYPIALGDPTNTSTLGTLVDNGGQHEEVGKQHISRLAKALVDWNITTATARRAVIDPFDLLVNMVGLDRVRDLKNQLRALLPGWRQDTVLIHVEGQTRLLPNPIAYVERTLWHVDSARPDDSVRYAYPRGHLHGDLHTGNVLCLPSRKSLPQVIDLARYQRDANPFYDLAYLEFDLIQHALPVADHKMRPQWLALLDFSTKHLLPQGTPTTGNAAKGAWQLIRPLRMEVRRLQNDGGGRHQYDYEVAWWLATVAVGLRFARMRELVSKPERLTRAAALLYAAHGLDRALKLLQIQLPSDPHAVPWLSASSDSTLSVPNRLEPGSNILMHQDLAAAQQLFRDIQSIQSEVQLATALLTRDTPDSGAFQRARESIENSLTKLADLRRMVKRASEAHLDWAPDLAEYEQAITQIVIPMTTTWIIIAEGKKFDVTTVKAQLKDLLENQ